MKLSPKLSFWLLLNTFPACIAGPDTCTTGNCAVCEDCHTHKSPACPVDLYGYSTDTTRNLVYDSAEPPYSGVAFWGNLYQDWLPNADPPQYQSYGLGGIMGSCSIITPPGTGNPLVDDCTVTVKQPYGDLMLRGAIPSFQKCVDALTACNTVTSSGHPTLEEALQCEEATAYSACCGEMVVSGGTCGFRKTMGTVDWCWNVQKDEICTSPFTDFSGAGGIVLRFDKLEGCARRCDDVGFGYKYLYGRRDPYTACD